MSNNQKKLSKHNATRALVEGALFVAIAEILGFIKIWHMPEGGSVSLMMVPMVIYALRWGLRQGLLAGLAMGVVDFMIAGGFAIGWQSILGDYVIAYTVLGFAGLFRGKNWSIYAGTILGCMIRFLVHYVVGATVWAEYMPENFFGMTMTSPWFYSLLYNGFYMVLDLLLCLLIFVLLDKPLNRFFLGHDIE
jgi:thiamine transporter